MLEPDGGKLSRPVLRWLGGSNPTWLPGRLSRAETIMRYLVEFFLLTYIVSWFFWIVAATISGGTASPPSGLAVLSGPLFLIGAVAPSLVALVLAARADGRAGALALLRRIIEFPKS